MTSHPLIPRRPRPDLFPGQAVHVNAHAAWVPATVISVAHTSVGISLFSTEAGVLTRAVAPWVVQPADGHRLEPVHNLRHGDDVVAADGTIHTVAAAPWQGRDGWWVLTYTDGERVTLPAGAVLRLTDPTPAVTVNGAALTWPAAPGPQRLSPPRGDRTSPGAARTRPGWSWCDPDPGRRPRRTPPDPSRIRAAQTHGVDCRG
jgi:hypothetical protein